MGLQLRVRFTVLAILSDGNLVGYVVDNNQLITGLVFKVPYKYNLADCNEQSTNGKNQLFQIQTNINVMGLAIP